MRSWNLFQKGGQFFFQCDLFSFILLNFCRHSFCFEIKSKLVNNWLFVIFNEIKNKRLKQFLGLKQQNIKRIFFGKFCTVCPRYSFSHKIIFWRIFLHGIINLEFSPQAYVNINGRSYCTSYLWFSQRTQILTLKKKYTFLYNFFFYFFSLVLYFILILICIYL